MMGRRSDQGSLFYQFRLDERVPKGHLLRRIDGFVAAALADIHERLQPYYSEIGRPSVDPELMIRMLIVGYCYGLRSERRLTQEVELHLAYRWFCRLDLDDRVPHHSTFSENRLHRFRESDVFRHVFERVVVACMTAGLIKGEGFAVDASVMEANASRYHGKAPDEIFWAEPERQTRAVKEYLATLDAEAEPNPDRKPPKVISPSDPCSAWTAKANKRVQFGYGLNYLIDIENAVIVDVEPTPARTYDEVESTKIMLARTERRFHLKPKRLAADTAYGTGRFLGWLVGCGIAPIFRSVMPASEMTAPSPATTFAGTSAEVSISVRTTRRCTPQALCTTAMHCATAPPNSTATSVRSKCNVAPTRRRGKFPATSMRMRATWHVESWEPSASSSHATSASASRCGLHISKFIMASNACGSEDFPAHATSSTSPPSCRTLRRWRCAPSNSRPPTIHLIRPSLETKKIDQSQQTSADLSWTKPTQGGGQSRNPDFFDSIGHLRRFERTPVTSAGTPKADIRLRRSI